MLSRSAVRYFAWFVLAPVAFPASSLAGGVATHHHRGTPTIDGVEDPLEWSGAEAGVAPLTLPPELGGGLGFVTFLIMSDDENLYAAIRFPYAVSPPSPGFAALVIFAWPSGDDICAPPTTPDQFQILSQDGGANYSDSFATSFCAADGLPDIEDGGTSEGSGTYTDEGPTLFFEVAHPLDTADDPHDLSAAVPETISVVALTAGCAASGCGTPAAIFRRVHLEASNEILYADFEVGDFSEWSSSTP